MSLRSKLSRVNCLVLSVPLPMVSNDRQRKFPSLRLLNKWRVMFPLRLPTGDNQTLPFFMVFGFLSLLIGARKSSVSIKPTSVLVPMSSVKLITVSRFFRMFLTSDNRLFVNRRVIQI